MLQLPGVEFKRSGPDQMGYCRLRRDLEASPSKDLAGPRALNVAIPAVFRSYGPKNGEAQKRRLRPCSTRGQYGCTRGLDSNIQPLLGGRVRSRYHRLAWCLFDTLQKFAARKGSA